ncbi:MAG: alpha/beta hydrolase, partial [Deltaproteobacteria bacterium]
LQEQIEFLNLSGEKLAGTFHVPAKNSRHGIIFGHCFTCSRHTSILRVLSLALVDAGFNVLRFDFSGNGQSEGKFSESLYSKQVDDLKAASTFMSARGVPWIGLVGHSMGAMAALLAASEVEEVKAVCTLAAKASVLKTDHFLSREQVEELQLTGRVHFTSRGRNLELTEAFFADAEQYDFPSIMASLPQPLLVIHGDMDEIVPVDNAYRLQQYKRINTELAIIHGADHMFSQDGHRQEVAQRVTHWFTGLALKEDF